MRYLLPLALLALASCTASKQEAARQARADSAARANWHAPAPVLPRKVNGGLTIINQYGSGNSASADHNEKAGQRQGAAGTAPGAEVKQASRREPGQGLPWWAWAVLGAIGWDMLSQKLGPLAWLPWRARVES